MSEPENIALLEAWTTQHAALGQDALGLFFYLCRFANGQDSFRATRPQLRAHVRNCSSERFASLVKRCAAYGLITVRRLGNERTTSYTIHNFPAGWGVPAPLRDEPFSIPQATPRSRRREAQ